MITLEPLSKNSNTEDLLKFANECGHKDDEGMDFTPAWISQELQERAIKENKSTKQDIQQLIDFIIKKIQEAEEKGYIKGKEEKLSLTYKSSQMYLMGFKDGEESGKAI